MRRPRTIWSLSNTFTSVFKGLKPSPQFKVMATRHADLQREAEPQKIKFAVLPATEAIQVLKREPKDTNAILHVNTRLQRQMAGFPSFLRLHA